MVTKKELELQLVRCKELFGEAQDKVEKYEQYTKFISYEEIESYDELFEQIGVFHRKLRDPRYASEGSVVIQTPFETGRTWFHKHKWVKLEGIFFGEKILRDDFDKLPTLYKEVEVTK